MTSNPQGDYFRSYRSMGSQYFGGNGEKEEFSRNQDGGIDVHINSQYMELCQMARDLGFQLIVQCSGVPVEGKNNGRVEHLFPLDSRRSFHGSVRYYPLPATNNYDANGTAIFEWMKLLHDKLGVSNTIYADMVYGCCFFFGAQNYSMMNSVLTFLNSMPQARKRLSGIPEGLKYIASADENKISIVLWNPGSEHYTFNLDTTSGVNISTNLTVEKGTESNLIRIIPATLGSALKEIAGLRLNSQEFMLITIVF